ncbi:hypothetical protein GWI33_003177 [Rhynchophorus ferrugineus]|uniref:Uncharacterized protein n=1 Tax=Rhynchophorus ferrugineus TaxID=354439 RepID=A0A834IV46_RHYFE|nr:hypothetical protein GWI33_003177 [Rhynchophorus ferrugineus]
MHEVSPLSSSPIASPSNPVALNRGQRPTPRAHPAPPTSAARDNSVPPWSAIVARLLLLLFPATPDRSLRV